MSVFRRWTARALRVGLGTCAIVVGAGLLARGAVPAAPEDLAEYERAGHAYLAGDYETAERLYEGLVLRGWRNGFLFYNLGNSYYQLGELGEAVRAYRRAALFLPRDPDLRHNLAIARGTAVDVLGRAGFAEALRSIAFWYERSTARELGWAAVAATSALALALAAYTVRPGRVPRAAAIVAAVAAALGAASYGARAIELGRRSDAVVLVERAVLRTGPAVAEQVVVELHEGAEVEVVTRRTPYARVVAPDGREGWVREDALGSVALD